jgi:hypothetical protein
MGWLSQWREDRQEERRLSAAKPDLNAARELLDMIEEAAPTKRGLHIRKERDRPVD